MAHILVVDDEPPVREVVCAILQSAGHETSEACDGEACLAMLADTLPDLVITDLYMEGMDGLELLRRIRRGWPAVPILVISGGGRLGGPLHFDMAEALGAVSSLAKPFGSKGLLDKVSLILAPGV